MWAIISGLVTKNAAGWFRENWRLAAMAVAAALLAALVWAWQDAEADYLEANARADSLDEKLAIATDALSRERAASEAARKAAADWSQEAAERARDLQDAIEQEGKANEAFAACMSHRWADGVIDRLPK